MSTAASPSEPRVKEAGGCPRLIVAEGGLPDAAGQLILDVVRRTRLWNREQAEVATELVAHFRDGMDAGRAAGDLVCSFGEPSLAARLIRRGKKRNRPAWWRIGHRFVRGALLFVLVYSAAALLLATRRPRVSVDYAAELDRLLPSAPADQQAWPVYRAALLADGIQGLQSDLFPEDSDARGYYVTGARPAPFELRPHDPDWSKAVALLRKHQRFLRAAREGGLKPVYGWDAVRPGEYSAEDARALGLPALPPRVPARSMDKSAQVSLLTAHRGEWSPPSTTLIYLLVMDSWLAATEADGARVAENYRAMLGMARHCRERPTWIHQHVATNLCTVANQALAEVELAHPRLLDGRRVDLLHRMAAAAPLFDADPAGERLFLLDLVQRIYSDDGRGDGELTYDGIHALINSTHGLHGARIAPDVPLDERAAYLGSLPAAVALGASRRETVERIERYFETSGRELRQPMWQRLRGTSETSRLTEQWADAPLGRYRNLLLFSHVGSVEQSARSFDVRRAVHEATITALALGVWHERHGGYPASLADLVPQYLPQLPVDHSSGRPLRYLLRVGRPVLYGLGTDGADDGGVWRDDPRRWPLLPEKGDWVLYPPPRTNQSPQRTNEEDQP